MQSRRPRFNSWVGKICWRRNRLPTPVFLGFPGGSVGKESACNVGDLGLIPGLQRSPGEGNGYPLHYFGLENSMDCIVHGVTKILNKEIFAQLQLQFPRNKTIDWEGEGFMFRIVDIQISLIIVNLEYQTTQDKEIMILSNSPY